MRFLLLMLLLVPAASALDWSEIMFDPQGADNGLEFVELAGELQLGALERGSVDALITVEPVGTLAEETLGARVNKIEHGWQSWATNLVVTGQIRLLDGKVIVPEWYKLMEFCPAYLR